ncbi:hypothetical protein ACTXT7_015372 [Hymenolepis weldensis]
MPLYPSLEALVIGKELKVQEQLANIVADAAPSGTPQIAASSGALAGEFLGIDLTEVAYDDYGNPLYNGVAPSTPAIIPKSSNPIQTSGAIIAGHSTSAIVPGDPIVISEHVTKNTKGYPGLQLKNQDAEVFIVYVEDGSPAAQVGLHFERVIALTKDSRLILGLIIKNGAIEAIVKDSCAERNGVLINYYLCEIEGVNVHGMKDDKVIKVIKMAGSLVKITMIPELYYDNLSKNIFVKEELIGAEAYISRCLALSDKRANTNTSFSFGRDRMKKGITTFSSLFRTFLLDV